MTQHVTNDGLEIYEHKTPYYGYWDCPTCSLDPKTDPFFQITTKKQAIEHVKETEHDVVHQVGFGKVFTTSEHLDD